MTVFQEHRYRSSVPGRLGPTVLERRSEGCAFPMVSLILPNHQNTTCFNGQGSKDKAINPRSWFSHLL